MQKNPVTEVDDKCLNRKTEDVEKPVGNRDEGIQNEDRDYSTTDV